MASSRTFSVRLLLFTTCLFLSKDLKAQNRSLNELTDSAWRYLNLDLEKSKTFADLALSFSKKSDSNKLTEVFNALGVYFQKKSNYDSASYYFQRSLNYRIALQDSIGAINGYLNLGSIKYDQGLYNEAIKYLNTGLQKLKPLKHYPSAISKQASILNLLGMACLESHQLQKAFSYLRQSYELRSSLNEALNLSKTSLNYGHLFALIEDYNTARSLYHQAEVGFRNYQYELGLAKSLKSLAEIDMREKKWDQAEYGFNEALILFKKQEDQQEIASIFSNLGFLFESKKQYTISEAYQKQALEAYLAIGDQAGIGLSLNHLAYLAFGQQEYSNAYKLFQEALKVIIPLQIPKLQEEAYRGVALSSGAMGNYEEAFKNEQIANDLATANQNALDALKAESHRRRLAEEQLAKQKERLKSSKLQNWIVGILAISLILFFLSLSLIYRQKLRLSKLQEAERLRKEELSNILQEHKISQLDALVEGQQSERLRISQDLHDRLGAHLSVLKVYFKDVVKNLEIAHLKAEKEVSKMNLLIDEVTLTVRSISNDLRSGVLDNLGLKAAIAELCQRIQDTVKIEIELHTHSFNGEISPDLEWAIYRNLEEALNNIIKHAEASKIIVQLFQRKDHLTVSVEDDGKGFIFHPDNFKQLKSLGLKGIQTRVQRFGGSIQIDSKPGRGTIIITDFKNLNRWKNTK